MFTDCTHKEKMMVSIISFFSMTYTLPDMKKANRIGKIRPMYAFKCAESERT